MIANIAAICSALAFVAFAVLAIVASRSYSAFLSRLRDKHPVVWKKIGSPSMLSNEAEASVHSESSQFLWKRQYREVADPELHRLGDRARALSVSLLFLFVAVIAFGCLAALGHNP